MSTRMGLLDYLTASALDEDYARAARRRSRDGGRPPDRFRSLWAAVAVVAVFGLLVGVAAIQTSRSAAVVEAGRTALVEQISARRAALADRRVRVQELRAEVAALENRDERLTAREESLTDTLTRLGVQAGSVALNGPGVRVEVDDAPAASGPEQEVLDRDLQRLLNALWESGAEAMAINGQRLSALSAVRQGGPAITVNYRSLARPYVVSAIGDPDAIPARFVETRHGSAWLDLRATYGLRFEMEPVDSLTVPAGSRLSLRYATEARAPR